MQISQVEAGNRQGRRLPCPDHPKSFSSHQDHTLQPPSHSLPSPLTWKCRCRAGFCMLALSKWGISRDCTSASAAATCDSLAWGHCGRCRQAGAAAVLAFVALVGPGCVEGVGARGQAEDGGLGSDLPQPAFSPDSSHPLLNAHSSTPTSTRISSTHRCASEAGVGVRLPDVVCKGEVNDLHAWRLQLQGAGGSGGQASQAHYPQQQGGSPMA